MGSQAPWQNSKLMSGAFKGLKGHWQVGHLTSIVVTCVGLRPVLANLLPLSASMSLSLAVCGPEGSCRFGKLHGQKTERDRQFKVYRSRRLATYRTPQDHKQQEIGSLKPIGAVSWQATRLKTARDRLK